MHVFMFGASGYVGSHVATHLTEIGHVVTALVRNPRKALELQARGMRAVTGDARAEPYSATHFDEYDAVVWAAQLMLEEERTVCASVLDSLVGSGKAFVFTSGTSLLSEPTGGDWSENSYAEDESFVPRRQVAPRLEIETMIRGSASRGIRAMVVRPPLIWGQGGCRIIEDLYHSARKTGAVCYVGRGLNLYTNVHIEDLATLYGLVLNNGVAGALYHAAAGEASFRLMAETIARHLDVPTRSVTIEESAAIWDRFMGPVVFSGCSRTRSPRSRAELGWRPSPDRTDILVECIDPSYSSATKRSPPSWVRRP